MDLVVLKNLCGGDHVLVGAGDFPPFSLRPNHAFGMENFYPHHFGVVGRGGHLDANAMEYLAMKRGLT